VSSRYGIKQHINKYLSLFNSWRQNKLKIFIIFCTRSQKDVEIRAIAQVAFSMLNKTSTPKKILFGFFLGRPEIKVLISPLSSKTSHSRRSNCARPLTADEQNAIIESAGVGSANRMAGRSVVDRVDRGVTFI